MDPGDEASARPEEVRHAYQSMYVPVVYTCTNLYYIEGYKERFDELECS